MPDRDWDKELAKIDKQLASLSDEELTKPAAPVPAGKGGAAKPASKAVAKAPPPTAAAPAPAEGRPPTKAWAVYARLTLSVALGVAIVFWPYQPPCGAILGLHLAAIGAVIMGGVWSSIWTWRHRAGKSHSLSLLIILWGLILASLEVLPRVGYGKPDALHPSNWVCK